MGFIYRNISMLNLLSQTKPRHLGAGDMEMVLDGDGHPQRPARIGLGHRLSGVRHRAELHVERESAVFRVRAEKELPELYLAGPCSAGLDYHVQRQDSQEEQNAQKGELIVKDPLLHLYVCISVHVFLVSFFCSIHLGPRAPLCDVPELLYRIIYMWGLHSHSFQANQKILNCSRCPKLDVNFLYSC